MVADPPRRRAIVLLNGSAGTLAKDPSLRDRVAETFEAEGIDADVRSVPGPRLVDEARAAVGRCDLIVVGGGDGTVSAVASALADTGVPLGLLPLGTLNHFAKHNGIPLDCVEAVQTIARGVPRRVDVAEVNGRVFVNNSSLGLYPVIVRRREHIQHKRGLPKMVALVLGTLSALRRFPRFRVRITVDGKSEMLISPLVFVGNNRYETELGAIGERPTLRGGELCLYVARTTTRWGLIKLAVRALFNRLEQARDFTYAFARELWVETHKTRVAVAADGEVLAARAPLHYRLRPGALTVLVPAAEPAALEASA